MFIKSVANGETRFRVKAYTCINLNDTGMYLFVQKYPIHVYKLEFQQYPMSIKLLSEPH